MTSTTETETEQFLRHIRSNATRGDVSSTIDAIDRYCWQGHWMMNVGDVKGNILDEEVEKKQPMRVLELGTFCGYSALRIVSKLPRNAVFITVEMNQDNVDVARQVFDWAGVSERVHVVVGDTVNVIPRLGHRLWKFQQAAAAVARTKPSLKARSADGGDDGGDHGNGTRREEQGHRFFDLIFIDHWKEVYLRDLKLLEDYGLIGIGTVIVADNVIFPGAPEYLKYVRNSRDYDSVTHHSFLEYDEKTKDAVEVTTRVARKQHPLVKHVSSRFNELVASARASLKSSTAAAKE